jgi:acyl-CoA thioester hydrolase
MVYSALVPFTVRSYEVDAQGHVHLGVYPNYLEEAATQASAQAGFTWAWYMENRRLFILRETSLRFYTPASYGDTLLVKTWVSDFQRVQSHREYEVRRASDEALILRGRALWVFVSADTLRPQRLPAAFAEGFQPASEPLADLGLPTLPPVQAAHTSEAFRVRHDEIDRANHVNNGVYLRWGQNALVAHTGTAPIAGLWARYLLPVRYGDKVCIATWQGGTSAVWGQNIHTNAGVCVELAWLLA